MDNTNDCSDIDGTCSCKSGWTGIDCGTDVNECMDTSHCGPLEDCYNTNGAAECRCKPGYENITADEGCQGRYETLNFETFKSYLRER
jgi:hypothetical protein